MLPTISERVHPTNVLLVLWCERHKDGRRLNPQTVVTRAIWGTRVPSDGQNQALPTETPWHRSVLSRNIPAGARESGKSFVTLRVNQLLLQTEMSLDQ